MKNQWKGVKKTIRESEIKAISDQYYSLGHHQVYNQSNACEILRDLSKKMRILVTYVH